MLRELLSILRSNDPLRAMGDNFTRMLQITNEMIVEAGDIFFGKKALPSDRTRIYEQDQEVNQLERTVRKQVVAHLTFKGNSPDMPHCLLLMSLVKDVERLGDYAKNLSEVMDIWDDPIPDDEIRQELLEIRHGVEEALLSSHEVFISEPTRRGHSISSGRGAILLTGATRSCRELPNGSCEAGITVAQVLGNPILQTHRGSRAEHSFQRCDAPAQGGLLRRRRDRRRTVRGKREKLPSQRCKGDRVALPGIGSRDCLLRASVSWRLGVESRSFRVAVILEYLSTVLLPCHPDHVTDCCYTPQKLFHRCLLEAPHLFLTCHTNDFG